MSILRARRITRLEETELGDFELDESTAAALRRDNIGVFAGGFRGTDHVLRKLAALCDSPSPSPWLIVLPTVWMARELLGATLATFPVRRGSCWFTLPEHLPCFHGDGGKAPFTGMIVADVCCRLHTEDCLKWDGRTRTIGSQFVADYRTRLAVSGNPPPLFFWTLRPAKAIETSRLLAAYCLDAWWYVDGGRLRAGPPTPRGDDRSFLRIDL